MFNWREIEELATARLQQSHRCLSEPERLRIQFLDEIEAARRPLRSRLASALVRIGARLDPHVVVVREADDAVLDGRQAVYLR